MTFQPYISNVLSELVNESGLSQRQFAKVHGLNYSVLNGLISQNRPGSMQTAIELANKLKQPVTRFVPPEKANLFGLHRDSESDEGADAVFDVPVSGIVNAGPEDEIPDEADLGTRRVPLDWLTIRGETAPAKFRFLRVAGYSMDGFGIFDGDYVLVQLRPFEISDGDFVVARVEGDSTLKQYKKDREGFMLAAGNPKFAPRFFPEMSRKVTITGKVIRVIRYLD